MLRRLLAVSALLVVTALATLAGPAPAQALPYPPVIRIPVITASAYDPCAGQSNMIGGYHFLPGETVRILLEKTGVIGTAVVAADGSFQTMVTIPIVARGSNDVVVTGLTSGRTASLTLEIPCIVGAPGGGGSGGGGGGGSGLANGSGNLDGSGNGSGNGAGGSGSGGAGGFGSGGALASTGAAVGGALILGVVLFGVGSVLTTAGRRRHGRSSTR